MLDSVLHRLLEYKMQGLQNLHRLTEPQTIWTDLHRASMLQTRWTEYYCVQNIIFENLK